MSKIDFSLVVTAEAKAAAAQLEEVRIGIAAASAVLAESDWMVIREAEGGPPVPDEIRALRQDARDLISKLREEIHQ